MNFVKNIVFVSSVGVSLFCGTSHAYDMMGGQLYAEDPYVGILNLNPDFGSTEEPGVGFHIDGDSVNGKIWSQHFGWIDLQPSGGGLRINEVASLSNLDYSGSGASADPGARITGKAWGQQIGWLEFGTEGGNQGVWIDADGFLHGAAWSRQTGYFLFGNSMNHLTSKTGASDKSLYWARTEWRPTLVVVGAPAIDSLSSYTAGDSLTVRFTPVGGTQSNVEISTNSSFLSGTVISSGWLDEGVSSHTFPNLTDGQTYYARVKAKDRSGRNSSYSAITSTTMDNTPSSGGIVTSNDGEVSADLEAGFAWQGFSDAGDIMNYYIEIATSSGFEEGTVVRSYSNHESTSVSYAEGQDGVSYYARVQAIDAVGNKSDFVVAGPVQVNMTGGVIMDKSNIPVVGATLVFIDEKGQEYRALTNNEGVYAVNLPEGHAYTVTISDGIHDDYKTQFSLATSPQSGKKILSVVLEENSSAVGPGNLSSVTQNQILVNPDALRKAYEEEAQEEGKASRRSSGGSAKSLVYRYAGQTREEARQLLALGGEGLSKAEFAEAYKESLEEALARNEGIEATTKTIVDRYGNERFAGYTKGRLGVDDFKKGENKVVYRGTNSLSELEQEAFLLAAGEAKYAQYFWVSESADVEILSPFSDSVFFVQSHDLLPGDEKRSFYPEAAVTWADLLSVELWAREKTLVSDLDMRFIPELSDVPKNRTYESKVFYSARKYNLIPEDFSRSEILTREKVLKRLFSAFSIKTSGRSVRSSFSDVAYTSNIFPFITTAHKEGWFEAWEVEKETEAYLFKPDHVLERKQLAFWIKKAIEKSNKQKLASLQKSFADLKSGALKNKYNKGDVKEQARVGLSQLISANDAAESHLRNREYKKNKPQYFGPTRAAWNPIDKDTKRKQMWFKDNTENIKRAKRVNIARRFDGVSDQFLVKQAEKLVSSDPAALEKMKKMPRSILEKEVTRLLENKSINRNIKSSSADDSVSSSHNKSNVVEISTVDDIEKASRKKLEEKLLELMKKEQILENQAKLRQQKVLQLRSRVQPQEAN
jgi:hypothetical protein